MIKQYMQAEPTHWIPTSYYFIQGDHYNGFDRDENEWIFDGTGFTNFSLLLIYDQD